MKPALFEYSAPKTVSEAVALLAADPGAMVLAGGQSLVPAMNLRLASPSRLVDIQHVAGLTGISVEDGRHRRQGDDPPPRARTERGRVQGATR